VFRRLSTHRDLLGSFALVRGSPFDSVRRFQTSRTCMACRRSGVRNPLSSTIFRIPIRGKSAKLLALDHGLTWANAELRPAALYAECQGPNLSGPLVMHAQHPNGPDPPIRRSDPRRAADRGRALASTVRGPRQPRRGGRREARGCPPKARMQAARVLTDIAPTPAPHGWLDH